jgi:hypothetical protein
MQESPVVRSDPETAVAIPEQPIGVELAPGAWKRIRLNFAVNKLSDSAVHGDQQSAVVAVDQGADFGD